MNDARTCTVCGETKETTEFKLRTESGRYRPECRACHNKVAAARRYGLTLEEYHDLIEAHGNRCAICKVHADDVEHATFARLVIDHDHRTGRVRGLLCSKCNCALGNLDDSIVKLTAAIQYLSAS